MATGRSSANVRRLVGRNVSRVCRPSVAHPGGVRPDRRRVCPQGFPPGIDQPSAMRFPAVPRRSSERGAPSLGCQFVAYHSPGRLMTRRGARRRFHPARARLIGARRERHVPIRIDPSEQTAMPLDVSACCPAFLDHEQPGYCGGSPAEPLEADAAGQPHLRVVSTEHLLDRGQLRLELDDEQRPRARVPREDRSSRARRRPRKKPQARPPSPPPPGAGSPFQRGVQAWRREGGRGRRRASARTGRDPRPGP